MSFDNTPNYTGDIAANDKIIANLLNSLTTQYVAYASLPTAGNLGVLAITTDGVAGGGGPPAIYVDNGSSWVLIGVISTELDIITTAAIHG